MYGVSASDHNNPRPSASSGTRLGHGTTLLSVGSAGLMVSGDRQHAAKLRQEVAAVLAPLGLRLARRKPGWSTSTRALTSSATTSAGCASGELISTTSTPSRRKAVQAIKDKVKTYRSTRRETLPLPQQQHPDPMDPGASSRHQQLTSGQDPWSARCLERGTPGWGGDPQETDGWQHGARARGLPHHASLHSTPRTLAPRAGGWPPVPLSHRLFGHYPDGN